MTTPSNFNGQTKNAKLLAWVEETAALCKPDRIHWVDGSEEENARFAPLLARLGKHKRSVACLYVNKLADIDLAVLEKMAALSWKQSFEDWPED